MPPGPDDLVLRSLAFPLSDLHALSSLQLALVHFHPLATFDLLVDCRLIWLERRGRLRDSSNVKFDPLLAVLQQRQQFGSEHSSPRSAVAMDLLSQNRSYLKYAGYISFKSYTLAAEEAGLVEMGGQHGDAWIRGLVPHCATEGDTAVRLLLPKLSG
jgi:hypothetical protein